MLREVGSRLKVTAFGMDWVTGAGTRAARVTAPGGDDAEFTDGLTEVLAEHNDVLLASYVQTGAGVPYDQLRAELAEQTKARAGVYPVFFGSAITGPASRS